MNQRTVAAFLVVVFTAAAVLVVALTDPVLGWLAVLSVPVVFVAIIFATIAVSIVRSVCRRDRARML